MERAVRIVYRGHRLFSPGASLGVRSRGVVHHGSKHRLCVAVVGGSGRASRARAKGICKRADR